MKNILVIWDHHNSSSHLLAKTNDLALAFHASVHLCIFVSTQLHKEMGTMHIRDLEALVEDAIQTQFNAQLKVTSDILIEDDIAGWVDTECKRQHYDLVIKTGHRSETMFHTPTDWQLMRELSAPLMLLSATRWQSHPVVLATVDVAGDNEQQRAINRKVLLAAAEFAEATDSSIHAVYNLNMARAVTELDVIEPEDILRTHGDKAKQQLEDCLAENRACVSHSHLMAGDIAKTIPQLANKIKADLVVMGSIGRAGIKGQLLGNTAESVIHNLHTDLLVIKP